MLNVFEARVWFVRTITIAFIVLISALTLLCKRGAPRPVTPVTHNGVVYSAPNDNGKIAAVVASDAKTGRRLWQVTIFETKIDPKLEEDVQWVFFTDMRLSGDSLLIKDEHSRCWRLELPTRKVSRPFMGCW